MMNAQYSQYLQWIGLGCTVVVGLFLVIAALLQSKPRRVRAWALMMVALLDAVVAFVFVWMTSIALNIIWMAAIGVAGLVLGWFTGRMTKAVVKDGRVYARLSPIAPWVVAVVYTTAVATLFYGSVALFSAMAVLAVFAAALMLGQSVSALTVITSAKSTRSAPRSTQQRTDPTTG
jgi:hypothetical protein